MNKSYLSTQELPLKSYSYVGLPESYTIVTSSLVRDMTKPFEDYCAALESEIKSWPSNTILAIYPEFCWRLTPPAIVFDYLKQLIAKINSQLTIVFGTIEFTLNGLYTNNAIICYDNNFWFVPKTKVIAGDIKLGLVSGLNPGVIELPLMRLGVVVCADLWDVY